MPNPNPDLHARIAQLSDGVLTAQQIADLVGKSRSHVQDIVRKMGLPRPKRGSGRVRQRSQESKAIIDKIKNLSDGLRSSAEIAQIVGSTAKYVQRIFLEYDLPRLAQSGPSGVRNGAFQTGRRIDLDGYVLVSAPKNHPFAPTLPGKNIGRMFEHRLVAEQKLGRYLQRGEVVDHVDGLHLHNHPDNLRVFPSNADHLRATISGKIPKWSNQGLAKLYLSNHWVSGLPVVDTYHHERARGDVRLRQILLAWLSLGKDSPFLLGTRQWLEQAGIVDLSHSNLKHHLQLLSQRFQ